MSEKDKAVAQEYGKFVIRSNKFQDVILLDLISGVRVTEENISIWFLDRSGIPSPYTLKKSDFEETTWLYLQGFFLDVFPEIGPPPVEDM